MLRSRRIGLQLSLPSRRRAKIGLDLFVSSCLVILLNGHYTTDVGTSVILAFFPTVFLYFSGHYRVITSYATFGLFLKIITASLSSVLLSVFFNVEEIYKGESSKNLISLLTFYLLYSVLGLSGYRIFYILLIRRNRSNKNSIPVYVFGTNLRSRQLAKFIAEKGNEVVVGLIDETNKFAGFNLLGFKIFGLSQMTSCPNSRSGSHVYIAVDDLTEIEAEIEIKRLSRLGLNVLPIQFLKPLPIGSTSSVTPPRSLDRSQMQAGVNTIDLLGRPITAPDSALMDKAVKKRSIAVTGAGGSIGSEIVLQAIKNGASKVLLYEISEFSLYKIQQKAEKLILDGGFETELISTLGCVRNSELLNLSLKNNEIDVLYHCAAYKHVPMVETNVVEGVNNNVFGTLSALEAAKKSGVSCFTLISTDKAVRPTNVMGASKRVSELVCTEFDNDQSDMKISMVRFGNVLGSSGSVVPLFEAQIDSGGPITLTHPEITRYFMTISEASQLVIQSSALASHERSLFLLDMGKPVKILDLAKKMALRRGWAPFVVGSEPSPGTSNQLPILITGLRPGEKTYEELLISGKSEPTEHPKIKRSHEPYNGQAEFNNLLIDLNNACLEQDSAAIRRILTERNIGLHVGAY